MIFKELHLANFGKFQNKTLTFKKGLNIIVGENESGKSTLFQAFLGILFGFKQDSKRYLPWQNPTSYKARLALDDNCTEIYLERDFLEDTVSFIQKENNHMSSFQYKASPLGRSAEREIYLNKIQDLFGFCEPEIFKHSLFIEQRSLHLPPQNQTATDVKQMISHISELKYDEICSRLEERYFEITKKNPSGLDKRNDRILEDLQKQILDLEEKIKKTRENQESLKKLSEKITNLKETITTKEIRLKAVTESLIAIEQLAKFSKKETEIKDSLNDLKKRKAIIERLTEQLTQIQKSKPQVNRLSIGLFIVSLFALPMIFFSANISIFWLILLFIAFSVLFGQHFYTQKKAQSHFQLQEMRVKSQLEVLPDPHKLDQTIEQHQKSLFEIEAQKIEFKQKVTDGNKAEKESLTQTLHQLRETHTIEKQNYIYFAKGLQSPFTLEEDLFDLKEKEKILRTKSRVLWLAKETLETMIIEFRKEHLKLFAKDMEKTFQIIAKDSYQNIAFEKETLTPSLEWQKTPISITSLSCGTQDQLYFSMNLSF